MFGRQAGYIEKSDDIGQTPCSYEHYLVEQVINIDQNSRSQTAMESVLSVFKLSTNSISSHRELVANCVHTTDVAQLDSCIALAVHNGLKSTRQC